MKPEYPDGPKATEDFERKMVQVGQLVALRSLAVVVVERLLVHVSEQRERLNCVPSPRVGAGSRSFRSHSYERGPLTRRHPRIVFVRTTWAANLAHLSVKHSHNDGLADVSAFLLVPQAAILVHVPDSPVDESLIYLCFAAIAAKVLAPVVVPVQSLSDPLQHEPCRLLSHSKGAVKLPTANPVLAVDQHPNGSHPLIQSQGRVLEDRAYFDRKLLFTGVAEPDTPGLDEGMLLGMAPGTLYFAVRPAQLDRVIKRSVPVVEVNNRFLKRLRRFHLS
jgi:hypothetical protein